MYIHLNFYVEVCVYVYIYIYIYIYMCVYIYIYTYVYLFACLFATGSLNCARQLRDPGADSVSIAGSAELGR